MNQESKRIFVGNLPATTTETEVKNKFSSYGTITSVEVKNKRDVSDNISYFAFVSLRIDHHNLQQCLQTISNNEWIKGHYVNVQMAKESFLERLKREREEDNASKQPKTDDKSFSKELTDSSINTVAANNVISKSVTKQRKEESTSSSSSESEDDGVENGSSKTLPIDEELTDFVIKSNKGKKINGNHLKIESFGKEPVFVSQIKKPKSKDPKRTEADEKRKKSMVEMKRGYQQQKFIIKHSLSKLDAKPKPALSLDHSSQSQKRKLNDHTNTEPNKRNAVESRLSLFDEENDETEETFNFNVNEELSGKKGKKLLELQSKFNHDKRFKMDTRFLEDDEEINEENVDDDDIVNGEEMTIEDEKKRQLEILGDILGKEIQPRSSMLRKDSKTTKSMLRFDPSAPAHTKYELEMVQKTKNKKGKDIDEEHSEAHKKSEETATKAEVSQETFYKVNENLKQSLQEKESGGFSLLNLYGRSEEPEKNKKQEEAIMLRNNKKTAPTQQNDSSDEEAVDEEIPSAPMKKVKPISWNENFFFADEDERFEEGVDFLKKLGTDVNLQFKKLRHDLKEIVRTKVRHNQRKNKLFKKKLGGKKMIKFKKAMKR